MNDTTYKIYEKIFETELLDGLIKLAEIEPVINKIFETDDITELPKKMAAIFLITIDNRNKVLQQLSKMADIKVK
jgi:hypothetical protein